MTTLAESLNQPSTGRAIHDVLSAGLDVLSGSQTITFIPYIRTVLPIDGSVFWMAASIVGTAQQALAGLQSPDPITVPGSLHYASMGTQEEDETIVVRRVDFAAEKFIEAFAEISQNVLYVGEWGTEQFGSFKFTFSSRSSYYQEANLHHFVGDAIFPRTETQLIDDPAGFSDRPIVSNSLPFWLSMTVTPPFPGFSPPNLMMFPSYLVPTNLVPPYAAVHIPPESTRAIGAYPVLGRRGDHTQLVSERVRVTLYGLRSDEALDFQDYVIQYCSFDIGLGLMNMPVISDDKRTQLELSVLAMKKSIEFEVSYLQHRARDVGRRFIKQAVVTVIPPALNAAQLAMLDGTY